MKHEGSPGEFPEGLSPAQVELLIRYEAHLATRGSALGLVATADLPRLRERHILDGLRGAAYLPAGRISAVDLGSGGGVPGVPIAIALPAVEVVLAEARRNRAAFLEFVIDDLKIRNARVHLGRAEELDRRFQACFARAFAPPSESWAVARNLLTDGGVLLYWAGARFDRTRDLPPDVQVRVPQGDRLAYGGPVVIMGPR